MKTSKPIQIFKPGKHVAMNGEALSFLEADLQATAAAYDPAKHEAPLVVGHPKHDDPAYGWVGELAFADGALDVEPVQVNPDFAELVAAGAFKKISASFYSPDSPSNPVPGVYYLRHVGFLGAQPPAVKGLRNPSFADAEEGVVEFSEWDEVDNASLWRSLREWFISKFGQDEADKVIPGYQVKSLEQGAQDELRKTQEGSSAGAGAPAASFIEKGEEMTPEQKARMDALEAENATLKTENESLKKTNAEFAEADAKVKESQAKAKRDAVHADNVAFAEGLVKSGKLLPASKDSTVALMDNLASQESAVEFGEGEGKQSSTPLEIYRKQLEASPVLVDFGEAAGGGDVGGVVNFAAPSGYSVDADRLALHSKALAYQAQHKTTYEVALAAVRT